MTPKEQSDLVQGLWTEQIEYKNSLHLTINLMNDMLGMIQKAADLKVILPPQLVEATNWLVNELAMDCLAYSNSTENADKASMNMRSEGN